MRRARRVAVRLVVLLVAVLALAAAAAQVYDAAVPFRTHAPQSLYDGPFVRLDGRAISYRTWGTTGTPVVLVPGFAEPIGVFDRLGRLLGRTHRVYALDLAGFGYTERRGPYGLAAWTREVQGFMRRFRIERPVVLGHSLGAAVAVQVAAETPVRGVVLADGDALRGGGPADWLQDLAVEPYRTAAFRLVLGSDRIVRRILRNAYAPAPARLDHAEIERWRRPFHVTGAERALWEIAKDGVPGLTLDRLRALRLRAVVVWGAGDAVDGIAEGRRTAAALRAPLVVLPGVGHLSPVSAPEALARAVERVG